MICVNADPAAPVTQSAKDSQEVDKTPTPPPQDTPAIQGLQEGKLDCQYIPCTTVRAQCAQGADCTFRSVSES